MCVTVMMYYCVAGGVSSSNSRTNAVFVTGWDVYIVLFASGGGLDAII